MSDSGRFRDGPIQSCWLIGLDDQQRVMRLPLHSQIRVGRSEDNDIVLNDARISRRHSRIAPEREGCVIHDLNSINGTFVNGVAVTRHHLKVDDIVRFGGYPFRVERDGNGEKRSGEHDDSATTVDNIKHEVTVQIVGAIDAGKSGSRLVSADSRRPENAGKRLEIIYAFMQEISRTLDVRELLRLVTQNVREVYPTAAIVSVYLYDDAAASVPELRLAHSSSGGGAGSAALLPSLVIEAVVDAGRAILTSNSLAPSTSQPGGGTMYAPLLDRGEVLGVIQVSGDEQFEGFRRSDLDMLSAISSMVAVMLQNARMHERSLAQDRLQHDLRLAAEIQRSFLPREMVSANGIEFLAEYRAAYSVGGDFYDVFSVGPDKLAVFIGDVSGKGVAAALLMARFASELRIAGQAQMDPAAVLAIANRSLLARGQPEVFYTAIYFTIDVKSGEVVLANAGHPVPYVTRAGGGFEAIDLGVGGAIGFFDETEFPTTTFNLKQGDSLVLYTDGIAEAADAHGQLFGSQRLEGCLAAGGGGPQDLCDRILSEVEKFASPGVDNDDLTLLICHNGGADAAGRKRRDSTLRTRLIDLDSGLR